MNVLYLCRVSDYQVSGNQIDIPKNIAIDFFNIPEANIDSRINTSVNICHRRDLKKFESIELQPATNMRWSTKLNSFLLKNNDPLTNGCLLVFEKLLRSYCVYTISDSDSKYSALIDLFGEGESHMLLSSNLGNQRERKLVGMPLQQIYYGAPGTGKSHEIKRLTKGEIVIRTTFHPDSDYSTFVGCYKPLMDKKTSKIPQPILDYDSLVDKFKEYLMVPNVNITKACTLFGYDYHDSIIRIQENGHKVMDLVNDAYKSNTSYDSVVRGGMACYEQNPIKESDSKIIYSFVPQAFTNAYVKAWSTKEDVYLIIEEINRGNCAQIFGDLFQLLDRGGDGRSEYPINADCDLTNYIGKALAESTRDDFPDGVKDGRKLMLPENFYIWATMNTSDQSLFPIDSAFKRRWDWKYIPIEDAGKNWKIKVNSNEYDWYQFLEAINKEVFALTHSEDKQLGYFFAKAKNGIIDADTLVNKVYFYLWTDVFKDYDYESQKAFRKPESNDAISFKDFFANGSVNEAMAEQVLVNLGLEKTEETAE